MLYSDPQQLQDQLVENNRESRKSKSKCSTIAKLICCIFDSDEELGSKAQRKQRRKASTQSFRESGHQSREKNDLVLVGNPSDGNTMLVRFTQKNFFVDVLQRKPQQRHFSDAKRSFSWILFSLFDHGVKYNQEEYTYLLPEKMTRYLSKRIMQLAPQFLMDANAWSSGPYLFTEEVPMVILLNENNSPLLNSRHNSRIYCTKGNIELIQGGIDCVTHLNPDILYVYPMYIRNQEPFSLYTHIKPDIRRLVHRCLQMSDNIVIVLPRLTQPNEITMLISFYLRKLNKEVNKIEIQKILIDGELQFYIVYIGQVAMTKNQNEYEFLSRMLVEDRQAKDFQAQTYVLLQRLAERLPFRQLMDIANWAQVNAKNKLETILQMFISRLVSERIMPKIEIDEIYLAEEEVVVQTPQYRHYTPLTFDPKELDMSTNKVKSFDESQRRPYRKFSSTQSRPPNDNVSFRNQFETSSPQLYPPHKNMNSVEFYEGSINALHNSQDQGDSNASLLFKRTQ